MKKERVIPKKNYIYLIIMILVVVFLTLFIFNMNDKIQNKKLETSYLNGYINEININEVNNILSEPSSDLFILITKVNDEKVYKFESDLKRIIKKYDLRDNFIYMVNNDMDVINNKFGSNIKEVPAIIYYKNGEFIKSIDSKDGLLTGGDFQKLIDEYEVK